MHAQVPNRARVSFLIPEICRFLGISIYLHFAEHNPPHVHVQYDNHTAAITIRDLRLLRGQLPGRVNGLVAEWIVLNREELLAMWDSREFHNVPPLV
jgi:hypothetical protein